MFARNALSVCLIIAGGAVMAYAYRDWHLAFTQADKNSSPAFAWSTLLFAVLLLARGAAFRQLAEPGDPVVRPVPGLKAAFLFAVLSIILFLPIILNVGLLADDFSHVPQSAQGGFGEKFRDAWVPKAGKYLRPIPNISFIADVMLFGDRPAFSHLHNALAHGLNAFLVARLAAMLLGPAAGAAPILAGLLFLVWPTHHEPVSWIVGRYDVYFAMFMLVSICAFMPSRIGKTRAALCVAAFAGALLSKETAVVFPGFLAVILALQWRDTERKRLAIGALSGCILVEAAYLAWRWGVVGRLDLGDERGYRFYATGPDGDLWTRFLNFMIQSNPTGHVLFGFNVTLITPAIAVGLVFIVTVALILGAVWPGRSLLPPRAACFSAALFAIGLFPAFGFLIRNDLESTRYYYLPVAGIAIALAGLFVRDGKPPGNGAYAALARIGPAGVLLPALLVAMQLNNGRAWIRSSETVRDITRGMLSHVPDIPSSPNKLNILGGGSLSRVNGGMTLAGRTSEVVRRETGRFWHTSESMLPSELQYLEITKGAVFAWDETARTIEKALLRSTPAGFVLELPAPATPPTLETDGIRALESLTPNAPGADRLRAYRAQYLDNSHGYRFESPKRDGDAVAHLLPNVPGPVARFRGEIRSPHSPFQRIAIAVIDEAFNTMRVTTIVTGREWTSFELTWKPDYGVPYRFCLVPDGVLFDTIDLRRLEVGSGLFWTSRKDV